MTDCTRPILSVRECNQRAELVCFGPHEKRIITDVSAIAKIEQILKQAGGRQIIEEKGSYVLEGSRKVVSEYMPVMPVVRESTIQKGLSQAVEKIEAETTDKNLNFDAEISETAVKAKVPRLPYTPGAEEREAHNATHCPFRSWCQLCVAGKAPDPQHLALRHGEESKAPTSEFDYAKASGKAHEPESQLPIITASESQHGAVFSSIIRKKGSQDEYIVQAFLNWISTLG